MTDKQTQKKKCALVKGGKGGTGIGGGEGRAAGPRNQQEAPNRLDQQGRGPRPPREARGEGFLVGEFGAPPLGQSNDDVTRLRQPDLTRAHHAARSQKRLIAP